MDPNRHASNAMSISRVLVSPSENAAHNEKSQSASETFASYQYVESHVLDTCSPMENTTGRSSEARGLVESNTEYCVARADSQEKTVKISRAMHTETIDRHLEREKTKPKLGIVEKISKRGVRKRGDPQNKQYTSVANHKVDSSRVRNSGEVYDDDTILKMLTAMKEEGYKEKRKSNKSMASFFAAVVARAKKHIWYKSLGRWMGIEV